LCKKIPQSRHTPYILDFFIKDYTPYIKERRKYVVVVNWALVLSNKNTLGLDLAGVTIAKRVQTNMRRQTPLDRHLYISLLRASSSLSSDFFYSRALYWWTGRRCCASHQQCLVFIVEVVISNSAAKIIRGLAPNISCRWTLRVAKREFSSSLDVVPQGKSKIRKRCFGS
jgi:hypothetical protein